MTDMPDWPAYEQGLAADRSDDVPYPVPTAANWKALAAAVPPVPTAKKFERRRLRVYVAGPISSDPMVGVFRGIEAGRKLFRDGLAPFMPHADAFWFLPEGYWEHYMTYDLEFVAVCEALYRLSGVSPGADKEVAVAQELGKPVFYEDRDEYGRLLQYARDRKLVQPC